MYLQKYIHQYTGRRMSAEDEIRVKWPLHWLVWTNDHKALERLLSNDQQVRKVPSLSAPPLLYSA